MNSSLIFFFFDRVLIFLYNVIFHFSFVLKLE